MATFVDVLTAQGWSVWWDRELVPGHTFEPVIDAEIARAHCVIVFWSTHSVQSDWVLAEASDGLERDILVPVMLDDVRLPLVFRRLQAATLTDWPYRYEESELQRVADAVAGLIHRPVKPLVVKKRRRFLTRQWPIVAGLAVGFLIVLGLAFQVYRYGAAPIPQTGTSPVKAVTVVPFENAGTLTGIAHEIADRLRQLPDVYVTSQLQSEELAANRDSLRPDTRYVVTGHFPSPSKLEVSLTDEGAQVWQVTLSLDGDSLVQTADLIAGKVARSFNLTLKLRQQSVPRDIYLQYLTAQAELRKPTAQSLATALDYLERVVVRAPRFAPARAALCEAYLADYDKGRTSQSFEQAERHCHRALTLDDGDRYVHVAMGRLYTAVGDYAQADEHLETALSLSPYSTDAMRAMADALLRQENYREAEGMLLTAVAIEPSYWANYQRLAAVYFTAGDYQKAAAYFDRQIELVLDKAPAYADKGAALFLLEDFDGAIEAWEASMQANSNAVALTNLGSAYFFSGQFDRAAETYQEALEMRPDHDRFWANVGDARAFAGEPATEYYERAVALANDRLAINRDDIEAISGLAIYHASLGQRREAEGYINRTVMLSDKDVYTVYDLAVARARLGDREEAADLLVKLVEMGYSQTLIERDANFSDLSLE